MMYSPIIIFAFNRLEKIKSCIASLLKNSEACESDLIVYVDGPRINRAGEEEKVRAVREFVKTISGFRSLTYHFAGNNQGLGPSLIKGVTEVLEHYGRAIVVEDDLVVSTNFLAFVNQGLDIYEKEKNVFSVSGETRNVKPPKGNCYDNYFAPRAGCWGWGTWKDRWEKVDWRLEDWESVQKNRHRYNHWGGSDCYRMLRGWKEGKNQSWAIRFTYSQFLQHATTVFPFVSKVSNEGFGTDGTNCKKVRYNRFAMTADSSGRKEFKFDPVVKEDKKIVRQRLRTSRLYMRVFSRIVNMF